jgi:uncharacterized LabA/DUF88 family protein
MSAFVRKIIMFNSTRVCIFVDGENLRHSIGNLFPEFNRSDYLPKTDWGNFFDWIACEVAGPEADRIRTYWYVIQHIDFSPYNLNFARDEKDFLKIKNIFSRDPEFLDRINKTKPENQNKLLEELITDFQRSQATMQKRFSGWVNIQNEIARKYKAIEFRRAGSIRYDLFNGNFGSEKAVDVKLATDLISLKDIYDIAVIVSGDQDYVPAVAAIKDLGKRTVNVSFLTENERLLPGGAKRLNQSTDWSMEIKYSDSKRFLGF